MIRIYTLGQFSYEYASGQQTIVRGDETSACILACLLSSGNRQMRRECLIDVLARTARIGEKERSLLTNRLDRAIYTLRHVFEPTLMHPKESRFFLFNQSTYTLAPQSLLWEDATAFAIQASQIIDTGEIRHANDPWRLVHQLEQTLQLYHGSYLPACDENVIPSLMARRHILHRYWTTLSLQLADWHLSRGALLKALDPLNQLFARDPTNEATCQRLMETLIQLGRRAEAVTVYERCAQSLERTFHVRPMQRTQQVYHEAHRSPVSSEEQPQGRF
ncbi:MAG: AfsR/SARP family transcriptional regulator [Ktedonobacteraceae bacterium]